MSERLPQPGDGVVLHDEDGVEHRSAVHAAAELLTVRRPAALAPGTPLLIGAEVLVSWSAGDNAVCKLRSRIDRIRYDGDLLLWDLAPIGEPWQEQRRRWSRAALTGPITVTEVAAEARSLPPGVEHGELLDISEVALRCVIPAGAIWASRRGAQVRLSFAFPDQALPDQACELVGKVLTSRIPKGTPDRREMVAQFEASPEQLESLRRYVAGRLADAERTG